VSNFCNASNTSGKLLTIVLLLIPNNLREWKSCTASLCVYRDIMGETKESKVEAYF
jgi:hypothetical protein